MKKIAFLFLIATSFVASATPIHNIEFSDFEKIKVLLDEQVKSEFDEVAFNCQIDGISHELILGSPDNKEFQIRSRSQIICKDSSERVPFDTCIVAKDLNEWTLGYCDH